MKRKITFSALATSLLCATLLTHSYAQTTLTFQPGASGKDTHLDSYLPTTPGGNVEELNGIGWTVSGTPMAQRGLIEFDLTSIPANAIVQSAYLTLYYNPTSINGGGQVSLTGSNEGRLQRIMAPWSEATATWNNQPPVDTTNQLVLKESDSLNQNYSLDVKVLVQGMVSNPATNYGFLLRTVNESPYRSLTFASSDHPNAALRPKLVVVYSVPSTVNTTKPGEPSFSFMPNPANNLITLTFNNTETARYAVTLEDITGKKVLSDLLLINAGTPTHLLDVSSFAPGIYLLQVSRNGIVATQKVTINR